MGTPIGCKRKTPRAYMKKKPPKDYALDSLWSKIVRGLAGNRCAECKKSPKILHAHHWVGRRYKHTRWLITNGICLCHNCHQDVHDKPVFRNDLIKKHIGYDKLEELELTATRGIGKKVDKEAVKEDLQKMLQVLEGE